MSSETHLSVVEPEAAPENHDTRIIESSGNVFIDLGFDAAEAEVLKRHAEMRIRNAKPPSSSPL